MKYSFNIFVLLFEFCEIGISKRLLLSTMRQLWQSLEVITFYKHLDTFKNPFLIHTGLGY